MGVHLEVVVQGREVEHEHGEQELETVTHRQDDQDWNQRVGPPLRKTFKQN
jgi:hypothetical protein